MNLDFYTVKTSVDIDADKRLFDRILLAVGFFSQPLIIGDPHAEDGSFLFRFAVRELTLRPYEEELLANLAFSNPEFTAENTEIIRAARI